MTNFITSALKPLTGLHVSASLSPNYPADVLFFRTYVTWQTVHFPLTP